MMEWFWHSTGILEQRVQAVFAIYQRMCLACVFFSIDMQMQKYISVNFFSTSSKFLQILIMNYFYERETVPVQFWKEYGK